MTKWKEKSRKMDNQGKHVVADVFLKTDIPADIYDICYRGVLKSGLQIVSETRKRFEPHGETVVFILSESHFTLHTYPEHRYLSMDCYTCGNEGNPLRSIRAILDDLDTESFTVKELGRGQRAIVHELSK